MFNESTKNNYKISFDCWYTDSKVITDGLEFEVDTGSAQNINSPKYLIVAHQIADRIKVPNKVRIIEHFDNLDVRKYFCEIDGQSNPKNAVIRNFSENDYLDQYRDPKLFL